MTGRARRNTPAQTSASFTDRVEEDVVYLKQKRRIDALENKNEKWLDEMENLQTRRGIRSLNSTSLLESSQRIAIDTDIDNQTIRSRCVEIKLRALRQSIVVDESLSYLKKYLLATYPKSLAREYKTITAQKAAIDFILSDISQVVSRLEHVIKVADIVINDSDQAGFTMKRIGDMLNQKSRDK